MFCAAATAVANADSRSPPSASALGIRLRPKVLAAVIITVDTSSISGSYHAHVSGSRDSEDKGFGQIFQGFEGCCESWKEEKLGVDWARCINRRGAVSSEGLPARNPFLARMSLPQIHLRSLSCIPTLHRRTRLLKEAIFRVVAAILHLGNIDFRKGEEIDSSVSKDDRLSLGVKLSIVPGKATPTQLPIEV